MCSKVPLDVAVGISCMTVFSCLSKFPNPPLSFSISLHKWDWIRMCLNMCQLAMWALFSFVSGLGRIVSRIDTWEENLSTLHRSVFLSALNVELLFRKLWRIWGCGCYSFWPRIAFSVVELMDWLALHCISYAISLFWIVFIAFSLLS